MTTGAILLFDAECVLCNGFVRFLIRHDPGRVFRFASLRSVVARELLASRGVDERPTETVVLVDGDGVFVRSEAALRAVMRLGGLIGSVARVVRVVPVGLRDVMYRAVARLRYRVFGRTTSCGLLTAADRARVLGE